MTANFISMMSTPDIGVAAKKLDTEYALFSPILPSVSSEPLHSRSDTPTLSDKYSPTEKGSPQSLQTKPWPVRPQLLQKNMSSQRWWETTLDFITILIPLPFFMLAVAVIAVNGKEVNDQDLNFLQQAIKAVSILANLKSVD